MAETNPPAALAGSQGVSDSDGNGNASPDVVQLKDLLKEATGREYKDDQAAIKAVRETFAYTGRAGRYEKAIEAVKTARGLSSDEDAVKYIMENINTPPEAATPSRQPDDQSKRIDSLEASLRDANFYAEHPDLKPHKDLIARFGADPAEVIKTDEFKGLYERLSRADEAEKSRSVIHSNPRLAAVNDKIGQAREAIKTGDVAGARRLAMDSVNEALSPQK